MFLFPADLASLESHLERVLVDLLQKKTDADVLVGCGRDPRVYGIPMHFVFEHVNG